MKKFFIISISLVISAVSYAQYWSQEDSKESTAIEGVKKGMIFHLDYQDLIQAMEPAKDSRQSIQISVPLPDGDIIHVEAVPYDMMEDGLAAKYPEIRTFKVTKDRFRGRIDVGPLGFHGMLYTDKGIVFIDPIENRQDGAYVSYYYKDLEYDGDNPVMCELETSKKEDLESIRLNESLPMGVMGMKSNTDVTLRRYRFAMTCTGEFHNRAGSVPNALAAITTNINRLNAIYELEHAIEFVMVDESESLIFTDPNTDPFDNFNNGSMLAINTSVINGIIGAGAYDIGHVIAAGTGGGIARLRSVCGDAKGAACSSVQGNSSITGGLILVVLAHEVGHQFGANHTFNNCNGNESFGTAMEPGSGSTIMSYAGLCGGALNVQNSADLLFHNISLQEVRNFVEINFGGTCAMNIETGNTRPIPSTDIPNNLSIPIQTPFELVGEAVDLEGDPIVYNWDQFDTGPQSNLGSPIGNAPLFRFQVPTSSGRRVLPSMLDVLVGNEPREEVLPSITRPVTFRFNARDNNPAGGGVDWIELRLNATDQAGPFEVLNPEFNEVLTAGSFYEIVWDVANTDEAPVNCKFVDIILSHDGGATFADTLISAAPNVGHARVVIPENLGSGRRIMVKANDNVFFQVNPGNFSIIAPEEPTFTYIPQLPNTIVCTPTTLEVPIQTLGLVNFDGVVNFDVEAVDLPEEISLAFDRSEVNTGDELSLILDMENYRGFDLLEFNIIGTSQDVTDTLIFPVVIQAQNFLDQFPAVEAPLAASQNITPPVSFSWADVPGATHYNFYLTSKSTFPEYTTVISNLEATSVTPDEVYDISEIYLWRVEAENICGVISDVIPWTFQTEVQSCTSITNDNSFLISPSGMPTIFSDIVVNFEAELSSVEVNNVTGFHQIFNDMDFWLFAPDGTELRLLGRRCPTYNGSFNFGFSDLSTRVFQCPPSSSGDRYRPVDPLSELQGREASGTWRLRVRDVSTGGGGELSSWTLNLCVNAAPSSPSLLVNDTLILVPGEGRNITNSLLRVTDEIKEADELTYTLLSLPRHGVLFKEGQVLPLDIGDEFTQADIDARLISYFHDDSDDDEDFFYFMISHDLGGVIFSEVFNIKTDPDFVSSTQPLTDIDRIRLFPNPASEALTIDFGQVINNPSLRVVGLSGQTLHFSRFDGQVEMIQLDVNWPSGPYILQISTADQVFNKRFVVQH